MNIEHDYFDIDIFKEKLQKSYGRILGIDFGTYKIGIALTDESRILASPHEIYKCHNPDYDVKYFLQLIEKYKITAIVMGVPMDDYGEIGNKRLFYLITKFMDAIQLKKEIPYYFHDESCSSMMANQYLNKYNFSPSKSAEREDKIAAAMVLQEVVDYLK